MRRLTPVLLALSLVACDDDPQADASTPTDGGGRIDAGGGADAGPGGMDAGPGTDGGALDGGGDSDGGVPVMSCPRTPSAADRARFVVVSHPFNPDGTQGDAYEVLGLDTAGNLSRPGITFSMGRSSGGRIAFTEDGEVGLVAQGDGTLGVFRLDASGNPTIVHAGYEGDFYAAQVVMDPSGESAWILDAQFRESGGGVYHVALDCDGTVIGERLVAPGRLPYGMAFRDDGTAVLSSKDVLGVALGPDLHLVDLAGPTVLTSADVFADDNWIVAGFALTANGQHAVIGDNAAFSGLPNRVAIAEVGASSLSTVQTIDLEDPIAIVASPFDDRVLVASGFGDAIFEIPYAPSSSTPLGTPAELSYTTRGPALPGGATMIERGSLRGLALFSENVAVRPVQMSAGAATDLGPFEFGGGLENVTGSVGVQP